MAGLLIFAGCTGPAQLALSYTPQPAPRTLSPAVPRVCLLPLADGRQGGDDAGVLGGRPVLAPDAIAWCQTALQSLASDRVRLARAERDAAPGEITALPRLRKLYIESVATSKAASVVLEIEYRCPGRPAFSKRYRGREVAINWFSSGAETESALNTALNHCLALIRRDLTGDCETLAATAVSPGS